MVDSILDNQTLRTHRRGLLNLELRPQTSYEEVSQFLLAIEQILKTRNKKVEPFSVFLTDVNKDAYVVQVEFFAGGLTAEEFNVLKQEITLSIIQMMERMKIRLASKETEIILQKEK